MRRERQQLNVEISLDKKKIAMVKGKGLFDGWVALSSRMRQWFQCSSNKKGLLTSSSFHLWEEINLTTEFVIIAAPSTFKPIEFNTFIFPFDFQPKYSRTFIICVWFNCGFREKQTFRVLIHKLFLSDHMENCWRAKCVLIAFIKVGLRLTSTFEQVRTSKNEYFCFADLYSIYTSQASLHYTSGGNSIDVMPFDDVFLFCS